MKERDQDLAVIAHLDFAPEIPCDAVVHNAVSQQHARYVVAIGCPWCGLAHCPDRPICDVCLLVARVVPMRCPTERGGCGGIGTGNEFFTIKETLR